VNYLAVAFAGVLVIAIGAVCLSGNSGVKNVQSTFFETGVTTEAEIVDALGPPQEITQRRTGERSISYPDGTPNRAGIVTFRFDRAGKLVSQTQSKLWPAGPE
jgi:hypothetical protein